MAEYDAFGRKVGEDEGAATPAATPTPTPTPTPTATPTPTTPAEPSPPKLKLSGVPSRSFGGGGGFAGNWIAVVVMIAVIAGGAIIAFNATSDVDHAIRRFVPTLPSVTFAPETPTTPSSTTTEPAHPVKPLPAPVGLGPRSLIRHANLAPAVAKLRHGLGRLTNLRVAPDSIVAQLVTKAGRLRSVLIHPDGTLDRISLSGPGFTSVPTIPFSGLDTRAPERLVRGGARDGGFKTREIQYLVPSEFSGVIVWNAFFANGRRYQGDASGRVARKF
jgi:hypothetical protein